MKRLLVTAALSVSLFMVGAGSVSAMTPLEELGGKLYLDVNLSQPDGQSCSSCHDPDFGFVDPDSDLPVSEGVLPKRFGGRNSPSAAYAMYAPILHFDEGEGLWIGGQFWDGRATGEILGDPLADQALGPFLNPVVMANKSKKQVIKGVAKSEYADLFEDVWGPDTLDNIETAYDQVALSIAAFERTELFAPFSSKYDAYLQECLTQGASKENCATGTGDVAIAIASMFFTSKEYEGMNLFMGAAQCVLCHVVDWTSATGNVVVPDWSPDGTVPPMFTDFTFDNLGVPKNTEFPLEGTGIDLGLGPIVGDPDENGKFKVMSLRNIGFTAPYAHNGLFKSLKEITHFYNTRDVASENWPPAEYPATVNTDELGDLGLTDDQEDAIVDFMKTLDDGYTP